MQAEKNDPMRSGQSASQPERFGPWGRYRVEAIHTRFDAVEWCAFDAEAPDEVTGRPSMIRQEATRERAMAGLERETPSFMVESLDYDTREVAARGHVATFRAHNMEDRAVLDALDTLARDPKAEVPVGFYILRRESLRARA